MGQINIGENTEFAYGQIFSYNFDSLETEIPGKEYVEAFNHTNIFKVKLVEIVKDFEKAPHPFTGTSDDELLEYLVKCCETVIDKKTLKRWLEGQVPNGEERSRENVYKLCFALGFNETTTAEFFFKGYLERPFNFKKVNECVYYYCLKNGISYEEAQRIIAEAEKKSSKNAQPEYGNTIAIGNVISQIDTQGDLVSYLVENNITAMQTNVSGRNKVEELKEKCLESIESKSVDNLLNEIYGFDARSKDFKEEKDITIRESRFPKQIKTNFPQRQQLENIRNGKGSNDSIRKAILMLEFFYYFKKTGSASDPDEFVDELNTILIDCGYEELYWRNPYDWMIGYSAYSPNPLDELKNLIDEFYLNIGYEE